MLDRLQEALDGLNALVDRVVQGDYSDEELRDEMLRWEREDCEGRGGLAELAIHALGYQLAEQGITSGSIENTLAEMQALQRLKAALFQSEELRPVEVNLPPEYRERVPQARAFRIGEVQIIAEPEAGGWHVSVSHPGRYPTWEELRAASGVVNGVSSMWAYMPLSGGPGPYASNVIHLFETPPADFRQ
jgi:hypothetical protein